LVSSAVGCVAQNDFVSSTFVGNETGEKTDNVPFDEVDKILSFVKIDEVDVIGVVDNGKNLEEDGYFIEEETAYNLQNSVDVKNTMKRDLSFQSYEEISGQTKKVLN
jgi:hypothetical protein